MDFVRRMVTRALTLLGLRHPVVLRTIAGLLRAVWPVSPFGVVREHDIREVLSRPLDFEAGYRDAVVTGPFVLALNRTPLYATQLVLFKHAVKPDDDAAPLRARLRATLDGLLASARTGASPLSPTFDFVRDVVVPANLDLLADYFGIPCKNDPQVERWLRALAVHIVLNDSLSDAERTLAQCSAASLRRLIEQTIAERRTPGAAALASHTILDRLLTHQLGNVPATVSDDEIVDLIGGLMVFFHLPIVQASTLALYELTLHRDGFKDARHAALHGTGGVNDVKPFAFEALRFRPMFPLILRHCPRATVVDDGQGHRREYAAGAPVPVFLIGGMFDPVTVCNPTLFLTDHSAASELVFGAGFHHCIGQFMAEIQVPEILAGVLRLKNLRRAAGCAGRLRYDRCSPAVRSLQLIHDP